MSALALIEKTVTVGGHRLKYVEVGNGDRVIILSPAVLCSYHLMVPWAQSLAKHGFRVIALDTLGARADATPFDPRHFTSEELGRQLIGAMNELGIEKAILGGTSIGANISLEAAAAAPDRVVGLVLEGPFLESGTGVTAFFLTPGLLAFTLGRGLIRFAGLVASLAPSGLGSARDLVREFLMADPARSTAYLRGLTTGRIAPPTEIRQKVTQPTLIMSFRLDPFHPAADAISLAEDIRHAELVPIGSLVALRFRPDRIIPKMIGFLNDAWGDPRLEGTNPSTIPGKRNVR